MTADLLAVTPEIIQRYNRPGPRYTSYPTVPVWSEGYFSEDYAACLQKEGLNEQPISLSTCIYLFADNSVLFAAAINISPTIRK